MPINELERHPFIDYLDNEVESSKKYSGLIIGSFPVYSCTDSLDENLQVVEQRFIPEDVTMRFFYCSRKSNFWDYCSSAFGEQNPTTPLPDDDQANVHHLARQRTIDFLNRNNLLITDVIRQTNRNEFGDEDSNLWIIDGAPQFIVDNLSKNQGLTNIIERYPSIENLYFTATGTNGKSPFGWFRDIFGNNLTTGQQRIIDGRTWGLVCNINGRQLRAFLLPTPKARGIHFTDNQRTLMFVNYLQSTIPDFYNEIENILQNQRTVEQKETLKTARHNFLVEAYRQAFVENNLDFDGAI